MNYQNVYFYFVFLFFVSIQYIDVWQRKLLHGFLLMIC